VIWRGDCNDIDGFVIQELADINEGPRLGNPIFSISGRRCASTSSSTSHTAATSVLFKPRNPLTWSIPRPCRPQTPTRIRSLAPKTRSGRVMNAMLLNAAILAVDPRLFLRKPRRVTSDISRMATSSCWSHSNLQEWEKHCLKSTGSCRQWIGRPRRRIPFAVPQRAVYFLQGTPQPRRLHGKVGPGRATARSASLHPDLRVAPPQSQQRLRTGRRRTRGNSMTKQYSYPKDKVRILLLEAIHPAAVDIFKEAGYEARVVKSAMSNQELLDVIEPIHVLGSDPRRRYGSRPSEPPNGCWPSVASVSEPTRSTWTRPLQRECRYSTRRSATPGVSPN